MQCYEWDYTLLTNDVDAFGRWRMDAVFRLMQEAAGAHSKLLGFSREALVRERGMVWMIARARGEVLRCPGLYDTVRVLTWYGDAGKITFPRYFIVKDAPGREVAHISTAWTLVDLAQRRIVPPQRANLPFPPAAALAPPLPEPQKLRLKKEGTPRVILRAPLYGDIDVNRHMNNASYIGWILDLFPLEWHERRRVESIAIGYLSEAQPGEEVQLLLYEYGGEFEVQGLDPADRHVVFEAQGAWVPAGE